MSDEQAEQPKAIEPAPVQLTRIEGVVNLIAYQMGQVDKRLDRHEVDINTLKLAQASQTGSSESWKTWLPIIFAALTILGGLAALFFHGG